VRLRIVMVVIVLLAALTACGPNVRTAVPGQLLYVTTFDAFAEDWDLYQGELAAQIADAGQNPVLRLTVDEVQAGGFTVLDQFFGDFDVIVQATQFAGPDNNGFGLLFRHQNNDNYYAFLISGDGYYQVTRRLNGVDDTMSDWAPLTGIHQGQATNSIRVIGQGNTFTFLINDAQVPLCLTIWNPAAPGECQVSGDLPEGQSRWSTDAVVWQLVDDALPNGQIGLAARSFDERGVQVDFDNLVVCGPQATPPIPFRCEEDLS
jgi:hypothetical protein